MKNVALITGASGGIGKELALIHAEKGGDLVIVARSLDKLETLAQEIKEKHGSEVIVITKDLTQPNAAQEIFTQTQEQGIVVSTLINNAGFGGHGKFFERELKADQDMIQVNILALTNLTHYYLQGMVERNEGKILNVSSTASFLPGPLQAVYFATKAFVTSFSQAVAQEVSDTNVTVTALCPGAVATDFVTRGNLEGLKQNMWDNAASARSAAECGYTAMEKGKLVAINEKKLTFLLNWVIPFLPRKLVLKISQQAMEKS